MLAVHSAVDHLTTVGLCLLLTALAQCAGYKTTKPPQVNVAYEAIFEKPALYLHQTNIKPKHVLLAVHSAVDHLTTVGLLRKWSNVFNS